MLIKMRDLEAIGEGNIDLAFRRWTRPSVKPGGRLTTAIGVLAIVSVDEVDGGAISDAEAQRAGFGDAHALRASLDNGRPGLLYRIELRLAGADPRLALRVSLDDLDRTSRALARLDNKVPWTGAVLALIAEHPGVPAQVLAEQIGVEKLAFKARVRRLKALELTESLAVGYRLSPRGVALLKSGSIASA